MVTLDVSHVFRVFGGPKGLLDTFDRLCPGHGLAYNPVQMWQQRGSIPSKYVGILIYCIETEGHHCVEFLVDFDEMQKVSGPSHNTPPNNARPRR